MRDVRAIAERPHPVGTPDHDRVRDYLVDRLRTIGCGDVHVQSATGFNTIDGPIAATIANVVCRVHGRHDGGALLLTAHYDGVPRGHAAADDGAGVAAVIETARALVASGPPDHDVIVLISDAEEAGLLGAEAFVDLHPWARDVSLVLNFDNRGDRGPVYMFQTTPGNATLIAVLARSVPEARANSLTGEVYRHLPSDTDLSIWLHSAFAVGGYNFAVVNGYTHYHTPIDDVASLDRRVVQQMGNYALGLVRELDRSTPATWRTHDAVYFDVPILGLVHYLGAWALPLAFAALLGVLVVAAVAMRRGRATWRGAASGVAATLLAVLVPTLVALALWRLIWWTHPGYHEILQHDPYNSQWYLAAFAALTVAIVVRIQHRFSRFTTPLDRTIAAMLVWALLGVVAAIWLPGATWLLFWPLLAAIVMAAVWLRRDRTPSPLVAVLALPALVLWLPLIVALETGLTAQMLPFCVALLALVLVLLDPIIALAPSLRPLLAAGAAITAALLIAVAESQSAFTVDRKQPDSLVYLDDTGSGRAWWVSFDRRPDAWTRRALGTSPARREFDVQRLAPPGRPLLAATATPGTYPSPVRVFTIDSEPDGHRVHLVVARSGEGEELGVYLASDDTVTDMTINGRALPNGRSDRYTSEYHSAEHGMVLRYFGIPDDGVDLRFTVHGGTMPAIRLSAMWQGLPALASGPLPARPARFMSKPFVPTDVIIVQWELAEGRSEK
ncbi:MAG: M20/M25/M40 family metallo-hydrolase [Gemmatimonadales bacterium]